MPTLRRLRFVDETPRSGRALQNLPVSLRNRLITHHSDAGRLPLARRLFDEMPRRTPASYNSMISACSRNGRVEESLALVSRMLEEGLRPTEYTFGGVLASVGADVRHGERLQPLMLKTGFLPVEPYSVTALMGLYGRHGRVEEAVKLFDQVPEPSVVVRNSMIAMFGKRGFVEDCLILFRELWRRHLEPSEGTFVGLLAAIRSKEYFACGEQIHGLVLRTGMDSWVAVANALVYVYSACSGANTAERMFADVRNRDVVSWNTMIAAFAKSDNRVRALELYSGMVSEGHRPNESTFASAISACDGTDPPEPGAIFHAKAVKLNLLTGEIANSAMMNFYARRKRPGDSLKLFDEIPVKTVLSWNALIAAAYATDDDDDPRACTGVLRWMLRSGIRPNGASFSTVIRHASFPELQQLHSTIVKSGYDRNEHVLASAIASYSSQGYLSEALRFADALLHPLATVATNLVAGIHNRCGRYGEAQRLLVHSLEQPDVASWNILMASLSRSGDHDGAFRLLKRMLEKGNFPDKYAAVSLLSICAKANRLDLGHSLHGLLIKLSFESLDTFVSNVLLDMYAKCGSLEESLRVFGEMEDRNLVSWTAMITALGIHGQGRRSLEKFREMTESEGFQPDAVVMAAVISGCRHAGLVEEGMELFGAMKSLYNVEPDMRHYVGVLDLLCKSGRLKEAEGVIGGMPFPPNAVVWRTFLDGCRRAREKTFD